MVPLSNPPRLRDFPEGLRPNECPHVAPADRLSEAIRAGAEREHA